MKRALFVLLSSIAIAACGGSGSGDTGVADTTDVGTDADTAEPQEEIVVKECTKADDCLAVLGDAGQCDDIVCDEADWTCKRAPKDAGTKCSDGDPCTKNDACDAAGACVSGADECDCRADEQCADQEDGDLCNGTLKCDVTSLPFKCVLNTSTVVTCSTANDTQCAKTACVPATGECVVSPVTDGTTCDDADVCTGPDTCQAGACQGTDLGCDCVDDVDCLAFDDGDLCTGYYICDKTDLPYQCVLAPNSVVTCSTSADTDCQKNACDPDSGNCRMGPVPEGSPCNDNNFCTDDDGCTVDLATGEGTCKGGKSHDCDDNNVCTNDGCDKMNQKCTYVFNNGPCEDYNKCQGGDMCQYGICMGGNTPVTCDDANACTADSCETLTGCAHVAKDCSDGDPCTVDLCDTATGACSYKPFLCGDGDLCTLDSCVTGVGCVFEPKACADDDLCTTDSCSADSGECLHEPVVCVDADPCTVEACDAATGECVFAPIDCADDDPCTTDSCGALTGECAHDAVVIDDADACTTDACDPLTGEVSHLAKDCGDGLLCTDDACDPLTGECSNPPVTCDDANACTVDACVPDTGACDFDAAAANGTGCDDGFDFTTGDSCTDGACKGLVSTGPTAFRVEALQIEAPAFVFDLGAGPVALNDALSTQASSLLGPDGYGESIFTFWPLPSNFAFGDGTLAFGRGACLYDGDVATHCGILPDVPVSNAGPVQYSDDGACSDDPVVDPLCFRAPDATAAPVSLPLFDLTSVTSWSTGHFVGASPDAIDAFDGYLLAFVAVADFATLPLQDAGLGLDIKAIDALQGVTPEVVGGVEGFWLRVAFTAVRVEAYAAGAGCNAAGATCDDANVCTTDACDAITGACLHDAKSCDDGDACTTDTCAPDTGECASAPTTCDDGDICTNDACDPLTGDCVHTSVANNDGDPCTIDACDPLTGNTTNDPKVCDDADVCTVDSCDPVTGECVYTPKDCDDADACTVDACATDTGDCTHVDKVCDDGDACTADSCNVDTGDCVTAAVDDGLACDDGDPATVEDQCTAGVCAGAVPPMKLLRSRQVAWLAPDLTWDLGDGAKVVNAEVGAQATKHIVDGTFGGETIPTPLFAVIPFFVGYPDAVLGLGYGACDDQAMPAVLTCTPDNVGFPSFNAAIELWETGLGTCSESPAIGAPCLNSAIEPNAAILFGSSLFTTRGAYVTAALTGDPVDDVSSFVVHAFVEAATTELSVSDTERVTLAALLGDTPPETIQGVTGWWIHLEYTSEPFGILGH